MRLIPPLAQLPHPVRNGITSALVASMCMGLFAGQALAQWQQVPLRTAAQKNLGWYGGEGCNAGTSVRYDNTGNVLLLTIDVGGMYKSTNGGDMWAPCDIGFKPRGASDGAIDPNNNNVFYVVGSNGSDNESYHGLWRSLDQGKSWNPVCTFNLTGEYARNQIAIDPSATTSGRSQYVYWSTNGSAGSTNQGLWRSSDGGTTWTHLTTNYVSANLAVGPTNGYLYIANGNGLYVSTDHGSTFRTIFTGNYTGVATSRNQPSWVYAMHDGGQGVNDFEQSTDNGSTWHQMQMNGLRTDHYNGSVYAHVQASPANANYLSMFYTSGGDDSWRYSHDGGNNWFAETLNRANTWAGYKAFSAQETAWNPTTANTLFEDVYSALGKSTDGGSNISWWSNGFCAYTCASIENFNPNNTNLLVVTSQDFGSGFTTNGGDTWQYCDTNNVNESGNIPGTYGTYDYGGIAFDSNNLIIGDAPGWGQQTTIRLSTDGATGYRTWTSPPDLDNSNNACVNPIYNVACADPTNASYGYYGHFRTTDKGATWHEMSYIPGQYWADGVFTWDMNPNGTHALYGAAANWVIKSTDNGVTWTGVHQFANSNIWDVAYDWKNNIVYIADNLRQLRSWDGTTERDLTGNLPADNNGSYGRVSTVCIDPNNPSTLYIGNHADLYTSNMAVAKSTDMGKTWTNLSPQVGASADGPHEAECVRVNPSTGDLWAFCECYGVWKLPASSTGEAPYNGPHNIPGTVQSEDYDTGGEGVAYHDADTANQGGQYRSDGVDIESCSDTGGGYDVGWTNAGEYMKYTVNVATAGNYTVTFRVASPSGQSGAFHLQDASGNNLTGAVNAPNTGGWQTWANVTATVTLQAGQQVLTFYEDSGNFNINYISFAVAESAYNGPHNIPGTIQSEDYDTGGEGVGYHLNSGTGGQTGYRSDNNGNVHSGAGTGGNGYAVGWSNAGEWYNYTVNVQTAGTYTATFQVASAGNGGTFHLEDENGNNLTGSITAPNTGSWSTWQTVSASATLTAGSHILKLVEDTNGSGDTWVCDYDDMTFAAAATPPAAPTGLTATAGNAQVSLGWTAPSGSVTSYNLYRATASGGEGTSAYKSGISTTSYTDTSVANGTKYYYKVAAVNSSGTGAQSSEASATPAASSTTYSFTDATGNSYAVNGTHSGINFGSGVWFADTSWTAGGFSGPVGWFGSNSNSTSASFTLPSGKYLKSIVVGGDLAGTYTISDGKNTNLTGNITAGKSQTVNTKWTSGGTTITITFSKGWDGGCTAITY